MCGKPMISCELGTGTTYVNEAGKTGLVVPPSDPARLAEAINQLINSPVEAAKWGQAARDRYVRLFTADRMGKCYANFTIDSTTADAECGVDSFAYPSRHTPFLADPVLAGQIAVVAPASVPP